MTHSVHSLLEQVCHEIQEMVVIRAHRSQVSVSLHSTSHPILELQGTPGRHKNEPKPEPEPETLR